MATSNHHENPGSSTPPSSQVAVVMVPLPAHGHLNQLLQLSRHIASYDIPIHYVCTATHIHHAKHRAHGWDPHAAKNLHFHEFSIPDFSSPPPNPNATNNFPSHLQPLFDATAHLRQPLTTLLQSLSQSMHRVVVIHDSLMSSVVQDVASIPNAESYIFHSVSAFCMFWYFYEGLKNPFPVDEKLQELVPSLEDCVTPEFMEFSVSELGYMSLSSGCLFNVCRLVEGEYMDLIEKLSENDHNNKHWAIGPFNPVDFPASKPYGSRHECLKWLDEQPPNSVIFISFGTTTSLPDEQIEELAIGLEESEVKFIWVLRDADRGDLNAGGIDHRKAELPLGFEDRTKERGIVLRDWAPQLEVLGHRATGGFLSHCGWNSCMESISMGVPIASWPMHSDQPRNAVLMTDLLKIGVVVKDWAQRGKTVAGTTIAMALRRLMGSDEGEEIRRRAEELGCAVRRAVGEGGVSSLEMVSFIGHIRR